MRHLLFLLLFGLSFAHAGEWVINKDHSEVLFKVPYLGVSELTGRFSEFSGSVQLDKSDKVPQSVEIRIKSSSIDTGHKMRDNHLRANDFLGSKEHPEIVFKGQSIVPIKPNHYRAVGTLAIKNTTRPFQIEFTTTDSVKDTWGYVNKFAKFQSKLNRKDFRINWNKTLEADKYLVGDDVDFWGVFQIQPKSAATPSSKHMIPDTQHIREREKELRNKNEEESSLSKKLRGLINGK